MYHYRSLIVVLFTAALLIPLVHSLTDAQKFSGSFNFVNQTLFNQSNGGSPIFGFTSSPPVRGGITYHPAFPGASYGNMSAIWGDTFAATASASEVLSHFTAYGDEANKIVTHYPSVGSAIRFIDVPQVRHYEFLENDNLLNLKVIQADGFLYGTLFWERAYKYEEPSCTAQVTVSSNSVWISNGTRHEYVTVTVENTSSRPAISIILDVALHNLEIEATTQVQPVTGSASQYKAQLYGLLAGAQRGSAQFQFGGSGSYVIQVVSVQC